RFMKRIVGTIAKQEWLFRISHLIVVVTQFMMNDAEVFFVDIYAHLQPDIFFVIDVPCTRMADHLVIARLNKERSFPECWGQLLETERSKEPFAVPHHLLCIGVSSF